MAKNGGEVIEDAMQLDGAGRRCRFVLVREDALRKAAPAVVHHAEHVDSKRCRSAEHDGASAADHRGIPL